MSRTTCSSPASNSSHSPHLPGTNRLPPPNSNGSFWVITFTSFYTWVTDSIFAVSASIKTSPQVTHLVDLFVKLFIAINTMKFLAFLLGWGFISQGFRSGFIMIRAKSGELWRFSLRFFTCLRMTRDRQLSGRCIVRHRCTCSYQEVTCRANYSPNRHCYSSDNDSAVSSNPPFSSNWSHWYLRISWFCSQAI